MFNLPESSNGGSIIVVCMVRPVKFGKFLTKFFKQQVNLAPYFEKPIERLIEQAMEKKREGEAHSHM